MKINTLKHPELSPNAAAAAAKPVYVNGDTRKPRVREYTVGEEIFNAVTHGIGAGLAVAALVLLIVKAAFDGGGILLLAGIVYGVALLLEYLMSTLYHAIAIEGAKRVFKVLDHSGIYLLIAGTYTPYCLSLIHISEPTRPSEISYAVFCLKKIFLMIRRPPRSTL